MQLPMEAALSVMKSELLRRRRGTDDSIRNERWPRRVFIRQQRPSYSFFAIEATAGTSRTLIPGITSITMSRCSRWRPALAYRPTGRIQMKLKTGPLPGQCFALL